MKKLAEHFPSNAPLEYPGQRNDHNYLLMDGEEVIDVSEHPREAFEQIDELLSEHGLAPLSDRIPVLAYGRNASPSAAAEKTGKWKYGELSAKDLGTIPMLHGTLHGHDVVWHGRPGQVGSYFSELAQTQETRDTDVEVWVQWLTNEQLAAIHASEGATYELSEIPDVSLGDGVTIDTVAYTAREASLLTDRQGRPISTAGIHRENSTLETMNGEQALAYSLGIAAVASAAGTASPLEYVETGEKMKLGEKKSRQSAVHAALKTASMSRDYRHETDSLRFGRADIDSLPRGIANRPTHPEYVQETNKMFVTLLETALSAVRPSQARLQKQANILGERYPNESHTRSEERARNVMDPVVAVRKRAHDELNDPQRERRLQSLHEAGVIKKNERGYHKT